MSDLQAEPQDHFEGMSKTMCDLPDDDKDLSMLTFPPARFVQSVPHELLSSGKGDSVQLAPPGTRSLDTEAQTWCTSLQHETAPVFEDDDDECGGFVPVGMDTESDENDDVPPKSFHATAGEPQDTASSSVVNQLHEARERIAFLEKKLKATPDSQTSASEPFVGIMLNGLLSVSLPLPKPSAPPSEYTIDVPPSIHINGDSNCLYIQIMAASPLVFIAESKSWGLKAVFTAGDNEKVTSIGTISKNSSSITSSDFIPFVPEKVTFICRPTGGGDSEERDVIEEAFVGHVAELFHSYGVNPRGGSVPSARLQNHARHLPLYEEIVTKRYGGHWNEFIKANSDTFQTFTFSEKEIQARDLAPYVKPREMRISLTVEKRGQCKAIDTSNAHHFNQVESNLLSYLTELLKERDYDQRELLDKLSTNSDFLYFLSPSFSTLMRFLTKHKDKFSWSTHPDFPTTIGLLTPGRSVEPAKGPAGYGNQPATNTSTSTSPKNSQDDARSTRTTRTSGTKTSKRKGSGQQQQQQQQQSQAPASWPTPPVINPFTPAALSHLAQAACAWHGQPLQAPRDVRLAFANPSPVHAPRA